MRIGEFSQISGISIDTLRYYDQLGLLSPSKTNQQRLYTEGDLQKLQAILKLKRLNFTLEEIQNILQLDEALDAAFAQGMRNTELAAEGLQLLQVKYGEILQREQELREIKGQLEHLMAKIEQFLKGG